MSDTVRAHLIISGRVQGVFFRANTKEAAHKRNLAGWVKNRSDGRVEAVIEGEKKAVDSLIEWAHTGSPAANVTDVEVSFEEPVGLSGFEIRR